MTFDSGHIDISTLPERFMSDDESDVSWDAFALCVIATLFMVSSLGVCDGALLDVVGHCRAGEDIVPLVLGETLHGIDRLATGYRFMRGGSPVLLTLWLRERLQAMPEASTSFSPWSFVHRPLVLDMDQSAWERWMAQLGTHQIRWWVPHWGIETRRAFQEGSYVVRVPGLFWSSFYIPSLVSRHFGMRQEPLLGWNDLATAEVTPLCMAAPGALLYFLRVWKYSAFPPVVLLRRRESVVLTTVYLDKYDQRVGHSQVILGSRREAILGPD